MSAQTKFLLETIKSYYNNPMFSDIVLVFNEEKYYLSMQIIKEYASLLFKEFEALPAPSAPTVSLDLPPEQILANLTSLVSKAYQKKTLTMANPAISKETLNAVFEFMYGMTLEITSLNSSAIYMVCIKFGVKELIEKCEKEYQSHITLETLFDVYQKAISEKSPFFSLLKNYLSENLRYLPQDKLLAFTNGLSEEDITNIVKSDKSNCEEDLIYEIADSWCRSTDSANKHVLMSHIKLELLSSKLLITNVKNNPNILSNRYVEILEARTLASLKSDSLSRVGHGISSIAIGKLHSTYEGYRLITKEEASTRKFLSLFKQEYEKLNGIYSLDDFLVDLVCCQGYNLIRKNLVSYDYLTGRNDSQPSIAKKHVVFRELRIESLTNLKQLIPDIQVSDRKADHPRDTTGIFVSNDVKF
jgi:hypothetical protein